MQNLRIALLSDIHGNLPALEAVVADLNHRGVDAVINLGDSLSGPLLPLETAQYLMARDWTQLAGNHERQILDDSKPRGTSDEYARSQLGTPELQWLATLRPWQDWGDGVYLCHATPQSDLIYLLETVEPGRVRVASAQELESRLGTVRAPLIACGHSHVARSVRASDTSLIVNPGSVGLPGFIAQTPYPHFMQSASPDARYAIAERRAGRWSAALITVPYDWDSMADLAQARGRPEWSRALRTGYVSDLP